ncbi:hypothetical protein HA402_007113 [Bradysia odoriphaga]|nr:hypothetical protein HA402_007113 [Bradysia odoriphaga]
MECTAEEIAEKRRIALERLKAKKEALAKARESVTKPNESMALATSKKISTNPYQSTRTMSHPYANKMPSTTTTAAKVNQPAPVKVISCSCYMVSESRFEVNPSGFSNQLINIFKTIPSRSYDMKTKLWSFHMNDYNLVQERVNSMNPNVVIGQLPPYILQVFGESPANVEVPLTSLEKRLTEVLMPFQKAGIRFGIEKKGRCLIADEMGLGKTYQALALADFYKDDWPLLICTTASTRDAWQSKIHELLPYVSRSNIVCAKNEHDYIDGPKILITSFNLMERMNEKVVARGYGFVIFDESHLLKNPKAKVTEVAQKLAAKAKRVVLLTGTPALSRPLELFTQLQMIDNSIFTYKSFTTRYCAGKQTKFGWDASGQSNLNELNLLLCRKFMIRRTKQDVLTELGEKHREVVLLDPALIWTSDDIGENMKVYASDFSKMKGRDKEDVLLKFYNETAHAKTTAVCAYVKGLIEDKQKFIIFGHHMIMLNAISDCLRQLGVDFVRIDGTTKNDTRTMHVKRFQEKSSCLAAVLSIKACNSGITLTAAQLVVFAELDWNPSTLAQAESRAHRIGQEGSVMCRYLMAQGTADDVIWEMLKAKENTLIKAGIFNKTLSDSTNAASSSTSVPLDVQNNDQMLASQSSLDDAIANMCTDELVTQCSNGNSEQTATKIEEKENKNAKDNLQRLLDDDEDDDFLALDY